MALSISSHFISFHRVSFLFHSNSITIPLLTISTISNQVIDSAALGQYNSSYSSAGKTEPSTSRHSQSNQHAELIRSHSLIELDNNHSDNCQSLTCIKILVNSCIFRFICIASSIINPVITMATRGWFNPIQFVNYQLKLSLLTRTWFDNQTTISVKLKPHWIGCICRFVVETRWLDSAYS